MEVCEITAGDMGASSRVVAVLWASDARVYHPRAPTTPARELKHCREVSDCQARTSWRMKAT